MNQNKKGTYRNPTPVYYNTFKNSS
jgi:hypothetical protein